MNTVEISGVVSDDIHLATEFPDGTKMYGFTLLVIRKSGYINYVPCMVRSDSMKNIQTGNFVDITGEIRVNRRLISVLVNHCDISVTEEYRNCVKITGRNLKKPIYIQNPKRYACYITIASTRQNKSCGDNIPVVTYKGARYLAKAEVDEIIKCEGVFNVREYEKDGRRHTAYEVVIYKFNMEDRKDD